MEDEQSTTAVESAPAEDQILSVLKDTDDTDTQVEDADETTEDEVTKAETEQTVEKPTEESEGLQAEDDPKEVARKQYEERQRVRAERRNTIESAAREEAERHLGAGDDEYDQRLRATEARQHLADAQQYVNNIEHNENVLLNEFERAKADPDLQIFNPDNKEAFNQRAFDKALRDYNAGYISYDANDNMIGFRGSLIEHLKETAELLTSAQKTGAVQQVRATRTMRVNADTKPANTPKAPVKDVILEILQSD